jgi:hypothetical protein
MTRQEAFDLIALPETAGEDDIKAKYADLFNEYQIRLTNAPTPNLKKLYQKNLQDLNEALNTLMHGQAAGAMRDLPSSEPVFGKADNSPQTKTTAQQQNLGNVYSGQATSKKNQKQGPSKGTLVAAAIGVVGLALGVFMFTMYNEKSSEVSSNIKELDELRLKGKELELYKSNFNNQIFEVVNQGSSVLIIQSLIASYMDEEGKIKKFEEWLDLSIRPGGSERIKIVEGAKVKWDGSVIGYAFNCKYNGEEYSQAGIYSADAIDGKLIINLDNLK